MSDEKWSACFRTHDDIRAHGAIGNLNDGIEITAHGMRTQRRVVSRWLLPSPPQLDLYLRTPYYQDGKYRVPLFEMLEAK